MKIQIDQSSKIEYTSKNTVIAFANHKQKSLLIKATEKRKLQEAFRSVGKPNLFVLKTFAVLLYILVRDDLEKIDCLTIDIEYTGKDVLIKNLFLQVLRKDKKFIKDMDVRFLRIGKKSKAHEKAINTFQGKIKPDTIVKAEDCLRYIL